MQNAVALISSAVAPVFHSEADLFIHRETSFRTPYADLYRGKDWATNVHPAIIRAVAWVLAQRGGAAPIDYRYMADDDLLKLALRAVVLELPIIPEGGDKKRVAYLRYIQHAAECEGRGRWTVGKAGGYLSRVFGAIIPGHHHDELMNADLHTHTLEFLAGPDAVGVMNPESCLAHSCMVKTRFSYAHPYTVYAPEFGWKLAVVRKQRTGQVEARALVNDLDKTWVRIYAENHSDPHGYTCDHAMLRTLLGQAGYMKAEGWEGKTIRAIRAYSGVLVGPYIDGSAMCGRMDDGDESLTICGDGDFSFSQTCGLAEGQDRRGMVEDYQGELISEDDALWSDELDAFIREGEATRCSVCDDWVPIGDTVRLWNGDRAYQRLARYNRETRLWYSSEDPDMENLCDTYCVSRVRAEENEGGE